MRKYIPAFAYSILVWSIEWLVELMFPDVPIWVPVVGAAASLFLILTIHYGRPWRWFRRRKITARVDLLPMTATVTVGKRTAKKPSILLTLRRWLGKLVP